MLHNMIQTKFNQPVQMKQMGMGMGMGMNMINGMRQSMNLMNMHKRFITRPPFQPVSHHPFSLHLPAALGNSASVIADKADGCIITDIHGKQYIDMQSGIGVTNLGHNNPLINEAVKKQLSRAIHLQSGCVGSLPMLTLAAHLEKILPVPIKYDYQVHFSNSGAEAVENAVKLARHATNRPAIIVFQGGFHGRTIGAGSLTTAKHVYRAGHQPLMSGVYVAPYPYCKRCPTACASDGKYSATNCCNTPINQLKMLLKQQVAPSEVAAILIEPIQGEGGYIVPPEGYMQEVEKVAREIGALLVVDEVQSGFGRTGTYFAFEQQNITPDIIVTAKGIANGFPLSAIIASSTIMSKAAVGSMGGTYGGNAIACTAANTVIDILTQTDVLSNVRERGEQLRTGLNAMKSKYPIFDVRGIGLMNAIEFDDTVVKSGFASKLVRTCAENGLLLLTTGNYESIRFIPPLTISISQVEKALHILDTCIDITMRIMEVNEQITTQKQPTVELIAVENINEIGYSNGRKILQDENLGGK